jgi:hypothetical protein
VRIEGRANSHKTQISLPAFLRRLGQIERDLIARKREAGLGALHPMIDRNPFGIRHRILSIRNA